MLNSYYFYLIKKYVDIFTFSIILRWFPTFFFKSSPKDMFIHFRQTEEGRGGDSERGKKSM